MASEFRPLCCYCGKPVDDGAWDHESQGFFSYGSACMLDSSNGRFAVKQISTDGTEKIIRRLATWKRAVCIAEDYHRWNTHQKVLSWVAVDLGEGTVEECKP